MEERGEGAVRREGMRGKRERGIGSLACSMMDLMIDVEVLYFCVL